MADDFIEGWRALAKFFGKGERHIRKVLQNEPWAQADRTPYRNGKIMRICQESADVLRRGWASAVSSAHSIGGRASVEARRGDDVAKPVDVEQPKTWRLSGDDDPCGHRPRP
jgi:hypothetical protein